MEGISYVDLYLRIINVFKFRSNFLELHEDCFFRRNNNLLLFTLLLEKLIVTQIVKFLGFYKTRSFLTIFIRAYCCTVYYVR